MAGLDGVLNKIDPGEPMDKNLYELPPEEMAKVPQVPAVSARLSPTWSATMNSCSRRRLHDRLPDMWIATKRKEHDALRLRPHPYDSSSITTLKILPENAASG